MVHAVDIAAARLCGIRWRVEFEVDLLTDDSQATSFCCTSSPAATLCYSGKHGSGPVPNYRTQPHNSNATSTTLQEDDWASPVDGRRKGRQGRKKGSPSLNVLFTTPLHHLFLGDPPPECLDALIAAPNLCSLLPGRL
ncbi:hypothetical protein NEUTE2DRAFT_126291 [Neurospora tetrasperma FGSC 2509]|nr:hypothetical protein NEUTE2DRAFT_126291 [Neurospora tetrasperma FGSC 2509]